VSVTDHKDIGLWGELGRKGIHLGALIMPIGLWIVPIRIGRLILVLAFLVSVGLDMARWSGGRPGDLVTRVLGGVLRPHEAAWFSGASYITAAAALCAILFDRPVAVAALIFIILGDTAAVFVGRRYGRIHIGRKTVEGSLAFFAVACLGVFWIPQLPMYVKVIGALVAAVAEALPQPVDDNLFVPLVAGAVMTALLA
jgi:dolichol kinase